MLECQRLGLTKSVGVSNFGIKHMQEIEAAGLPLPACNQLELHPLGQKRELLAWMKGRAILPVAYSSLAPLSSWRAGYDAWGGSKTQEQVVVHQAKIQAVADRVGATPGQVLLKYALQKDWVILPKSVSEARIKENFTLSHIELSSSDMTELDSMECGASFAFGGVGNSFDPSSVA